MRTLNLGILAHVDAGKTTLTERLLFTAGAIDHVGSVDAGTTQTDSLELERERGITIRSAVASFLVGDLAVNLVDTPGHPDFIAEVERVLGVLDGAVLVVSAVEGVQPQTPLLFRALQRLTVPTLIFVNKIDRPGADPSASSRRWRAGSSPASCRWAGSVTPAGATRPSCPFLRTTPLTSTALTEILAEHDEAILGAFVGDEAALPYPRLRQTLAAQTRRGAVHPVFFGSAVHGDRASPSCSPGSKSCCPAKRRRRRARIGTRVQDRADAPPGERVAYVRLFAGTLRPASACRSAEARRRRRRRSGSLLPPVRRAATSSRPVRWPRFAASARSGWGTPSACRRRARRRGAFPAAGARGGRLRRASPSKQGSLRAALTQLAEQDPLIDVRQDEHRHEISVSLYGEVQKEVIQTTLEREYGIAADFRETTTVCIERPARVGEAEEVIRAKTQDEHHRPQLADKRQPVHGDPGAADRAGAVRLRARVPQRRRGTLRPAVPVPYRRDVHDADGGVRPRGADRGPRRLAGDRLPGRR